MKRTVALGALVGVACLVAAVVLATIGRGTPVPRPATAAEPHPQFPSNAVLHARSFSATIPAGWSSRARSWRGRSRKVLSSTGAGIDRQRIAPAGTVAITIDELPVRRLVRGRRFSQASLSVLELLAQDVGAPRGAVEPRLASAPQLTRLGGLTAAEESYSYTFDGRANVQVDVIARRAGRIVRVELNAEPRLAEQSSRALVQLTSSWHWQ